MRAYAVGHMRSKPFHHTLLPLSIAVLITASLLLPLGWLIGRAGFGLLSTRDLDALWFTIWQAAISAGLSCLFAIPVARALSRQTFVGRRLLVMLLGAPFILPVIVAILGLVAVFGRSGFVNEALTALGLPNMTIYGPHGVILAHVFFNMPLAARLLLQGWASIPSERFRLAASLGFGPGAMWQQIEWPMLKRVLPGLFVVIFLICTTSFAVALALGGGPRATTLELAIYQAFRFDVNLPRAATLALCQLGLGLLISLIALRLPLPESLAQGLDRPIKRWDGRRVATRITDGLILILATAFLLVPMLSILVQGAPHVLSLPESVWAAVIRSAWMALTSAALTLALALPLAFAIGRGAWGFEVTSLLSLSISPLVLGTGAYLILLPYTNPIAWALPLTIWVNALLALPFALRALLPEARILHRDYARLSSSLGMTGWAWLRLVALPRLRAPLGFAAGLAAALSAGDLGVIALFARPDQATLPLLIFQLKESYRLDDAKAAALLLVGMSLVLFWVFHAAGKGKRA